MATDIDVARGLMFELTSLAVLKQDIWDFKRKHEEIIATLEEADMTVPEHLRKAHGDLQFLLDDLSMTEQAKTRELEAIWFRQAQAGA